MQLSRALELLVLGLSAISVAEATVLNGNRGGSDGKGIQRRQNGDDSSSDTKTTSTPPVQTTSTPKPTATTTTDKTPTTSTTPTQSPTTANTSPTGSPTSSSSSSKETPPSSTTSNTNPSPTPTQSSTSVPESQKEEPATVTIITTWTSTAADGSRVTMTSQTISTSTPGLANNKGSGQESGMSPQTRNTVIGVVVGVGGAIILAGLALVAWRIWGRKKHQEENDALMDYGSTVEKPDSGAPSSVNGRTPFQSTLESYHAPTQVNTAANF